MSISIGGYNVMSSVTPSWLDCCLETEEGTSTSVWDVNAFLC